MEIDATGIFRSIYAIKVEPGGVTEPGLSHISGMPVKVALAFQDNTSIDGSPAAHTPPAVNSPQGHILHIYMREEEAKALLEDLQRRLLKL